MPRLRPDAWRRHAPSAFLLLSLCACRAPAPPPATGSGDVDPSQDQAQVAHCMPTALVSLPLPLDEGFAVAHDHPAQAPAVVDCVFGLFGAGPLKSPAAFDRGYGRVFAHHEEDGTLALASLPRDQVQLFRLGAVGDAHTWLLRVDSGFDFDDRHHDVLFSTARGSGELLDQLLVGGHGIYYRRDYSITAPDRFSIREDTGRGADAGPGYRARYRVGSDGRFMLQAGEVLPPPRVPAPP